MNSRWRIRLRNTPQLSNSIFCRTVIPCLQWVRLSFSHMLLRQKVESTYSLPPMIRILNPDHIQPIFIDSVREKRINLLYQRRKDWCPIAMYINWVLYSNTVDMVIFSLIKALFPRAL
jgi:hypothetical protein